MAVRDRIRKYREQGGAAEFVRVEVLVPPDGRAAVLAHAAALRRKHREAGSHLDAAIAEALRLYGPRATDNIDLDKLSSPAKRALVLANGLMDRGDARAYVMARRLIELADGQHDGAQ